MDFTFSKVIAPLRLRVLQTHEAADKIKSINKHISCKSGCSHCCSRLVPVLMIEAVIIYDYLKKNNLWDGVKLKAKEHAPLANKTNLISWYHMNIKCSVLDTETNKCKAYPVRPVACSTHFVVSNPEACDPWGTSAHIYQTIDANEIADGFRKKVFKQLNSYGILTMELPLPIALLLAEKINTKSGLSLDQAISLIFNEL